MLNLEITVSNQALLKHVHYLIEQPHMPRMSLSFYKYTNMWLFTIEGVTTQINSSLASRIMNIARKNKHE